MYARVHNITNVAGRENYIKNKENREEVVGFYNTASDGFWSLLAKENQEQFKRSTNAKRGNSKASEAREIVFGLPSFANDEVAAQILAHTLKKNLGVECMVAIHQKKRVNEAGEKVLNLHAHIIFAERQMLDAPIQVEEKRAARTYYYDAAGKKCKKADAVKATPKGSITQEACTRYFSDKINFFDFKTLEPLINDFAAQFDFEKFDISKHFPQRKIGQNNPKEKIIREYNELVKEMNSFFDSVDSACPAKEDFCKKYSVPQRFGINRVDEVRGCFENYKFELSRSDEKELRAELQVLLEEKAEIEEDIKMAEVALAPTTDFVAEKVALARRNDLERKYHCQIDKHFLSYLKERLSSVLKEIGAVLKKLQLLGHQEKTVNDVPKEHVADRDAMEK